MSFTILWLLWLLYFVAVELEAFFHNWPADSLSAHVWTWFSVNGHGPFWKLRRFVLIALMCWLTVHFLTGGKYV